MAIGTKENQSGAVKPSSIEQMAWEGNLWAVRYTEIPSNMQMRIEYNATGTTKYAGYGARGLASSDTGWLLQKFTYDGSNRVTLRQIAYSSWDLRNDGSTEYA